MNAFRQLRISSLSLPVYFTLLWQVYMVMKGQGRSEGASSSALKPSSAKFLTGSKNSEQVNSNPAPTIGGSMDLFKLSDVNIQVRRWAGGSLVSYQYAGPQGC